MHNDLRIHAWPLYCAMLLHTAYGGSGCCRSYDHGDRRKPDCSDVSRCESTGYLLGAILDSMVPPFLTRRVGSKVSIYLFLHVWSGWLKICQPGLIYLCGVIGSSLVTQPGTFSGPSIDLFAGAYGKGRTRRHHHPRRIRICPQVDNGILSTW